MTNAQIEERLGCTPCICGAVDTWHPRCYAGKSQKEIDAAYKSVFAKIRAGFTSDRRAALELALRSLKGGTAR